ncbi:hypothetical protein KJ819_02480 [Patescibacteria group bacterium]|nr:hypothetical protein [Patescibacteria group bacterium]MBU1500851.1 hypothetical protein [Patescibacteria group bacterium]MBU2080906.1 hypothetical protein [Patescibacteria group bacterium]MBU2124011.1 hypothetical protein [Patescibacteria group bacterium]MBU2194698.1 hypothetical protein [Patescibacteria group bacterium]
MHCEGLITYEPLGTEPDWRAIPEFAHIPVLYTVPQDSAQNPFVLAEMLCTQYLQQRIAVLVPGQLFDKEGTRHGRGGGWYDRFLSALPTSWIRIGICTTEHYSESSLIKQEWDQSMDILYIQELASSWRVLSVS